MIPLVICDLCQRNTRESLKDHRQHLLANPVNPGFLCVDCFAQTVFDQLSQQNAYTDSESNPINKYKTVRDYVISSLYKKIEHVRNELLTMTTEPTLLTALQNICIEMIREKTQCDKRYIFSIALASDGSLPINYTESLFPLFSRALQIEKQALDTLRQNQPACHPIEQVTQVEQLLRDQEENKEKPLSRISSLRVKITRPFTAAPKKRSF